MNGIEIQTSDSPAAKDYDFLYRQLDGLGYSVFGRLEDYPSGHTRIFLQKRNLPK